MSENPKSPALAPPQCGFIEHLWLTWQAAAPLCTANGSASANERGTLPRIVATDHESACYGFEIWHKKAVLLAKARNRFRDRRFFCDLIDLKDWIHDLPPEPAQRFRWTMMFLGTMPSAAPIPTDWI